MINGRKAIVLVYALLVACGLLSSKVSASTGDASTQVSLRELYNKAQSKWPSIETADGRHVSDFAVLRPLGKAPEPSHVALGKALFFDTRLSKNNSVSCASCHEPRLQFADKRRVAIGINAQQGKRNTPAIFGIDHWQSFFWDGRAKNALEQALMPIEDPLEMNLSVAEALKRINTNPNYIAMTQQVFSSQKMTKDQLAQALVAFQRSINLPSSKFSQFLSRLSNQVAQAADTFTEQELHGLHLFRTKAKCMTCHQGPLLSDNKFHVTGLHFYGRRFEDLGRYHASKDPKDKGKFRTASLLLVSQTGPWMHNGLFDDLAGIVNFYNNGGARPKPRAHVADDPNFPVTTDLLPKLQLSDKEKDALVAFLKTL